CLLATFAAFIMLAAVVMPAVGVSAAKNLTPNGLPSDDAASARHNTYAWCGEVFSQDDGNDYLWVGTNRDMGATVLGASAGTPAWLYTTLGIPPRDADQAGKIYRLNLNDPNADWELMWEDDHINGYRKMIIFNGELFVFAGLTNVPDPRVGDEYSLVYRFGSDAKPMGDDDFKAPDVVLWDNLYPNGIEFFRAASADGDDWLYVGTFDLKVWRINAENLAAMDPKEPNVETVIGEDRYAGWELVVNVAPLLDAPGYWMFYNIWDIIWFNGSLYVFVGSALNVSPLDALGGFLVYKLTPDGDGGWEAAEQIVGDSTASQYPAGLGIGKHATASPFIISAGGEEFVYVTTFANGPYFLGSLAADMLGLIPVLTGGMDPSSPPSITWSSFETFYEPATIYRFDTNDVWEVVVGDDGKAVDKDGDPVPFAPGSNMRAGFYPGTGTNPSSNQYVWWMAEHDGKIYASTWDMGNFRAPLQTLMDTIFTLAYGDTNRVALVTAIENLQNSIIALQDALDIDYEIFMTEIASSLATALTDALAGGADLMAVLIQLRDDIMDVLRDTFTELVSTSVDFYNAVTAFIGLMSDTGSDLIMATIILMSIMFTTPMFGLFLMDSSDPPGFGLFCSDDGTNFYPITVNGFGDATNYGGRVLIPSEYGLFVFTANPFTGCQIWLLDDVKPGISFSVPETVSLKVGGSVEFIMESTALLPHDLWVTLSDGTVALAVIEYVGEADGIPTDYWSVVETVAGPLGQIRYVETSMDSVPVHQYKVTLTGLQKFDGTLTLAIGIGGMEHSSSFGLSVTEDEREIDWIKVALASAMVVIGVIGIAYFVIRMIRP
ncbi:MAG: hypothetical protein FWD81_06445, partial [Methanomassiliicoccaceae archaeon]|nr:hypothetical protein [Methanomassiliicoccaceae archaeon]